jgi:ribosome-binding factor A
MLRVGEQVRAAITQVLQRGEVRDPILSNTLISVTEVRMSPDLQVATAYVTPLGVEDHAATIAALNKNARFIRGRDLAGPAPDAQHPGASLPRRHQLRELFED